MNPIDIMAENIDITSTQYDMDTINSYIYPIEEDQLLKKNQ